MRVRDLCRTGVITAQVGETLVEVARRMQDADISALPVAHRDELVGIITERDLARAVAAGVDPWHAKTGQYMTPDPVTADPDDEPSLAARLMRELGVRHLPVVEGGDVIGMISARDIMALEAMDPEPIEARP